MEMYKKNCKSFLTLDKNENVTSEPILQINDLDEPALLRRQKLSNVVKQKAISDVSTKPSQLICTELSGGCITSTVSDVNLVCENIYNARRSILLKLTNAVNQGSGIFL